MTRRYKILIMCGLISVCLYMSYSAAAAADSKKINDVAQLSFIDSSGNTDLTTLLAVNTFKYIPRDYLKATWKVEALNSSQDGVKKAERYATSVRLDYKIRGKLYSFGDVAWLQDEFAKIDDRYYFGAGIGYQLLEGPQHVLDAEAGLNYTMDTYTDNTDKNYTGGRLFGKYTYNFSDKNKFEQALEYLHDIENSDNYNINSDTSITSALNSILSLKTGYQIKYDNDPVAGAEYSDRTLAVTLVVNLL